MHVPENYYENVRKGIVHSHAAFNWAADNENFSQLGDISLSNNWKIPIYVSTPAGYVKKYDPNSENKETIVLGWGVYRDPFTMDN